jgi:hypothetical protein
LTGKLNLRLVWCNEKSNTEYIQGFAKAVNVFFENLSQVAHGRDGGSF